MTSVHLYQAEQKDFENVYDLLIEFKAITISLFSDVGYNQSDVNEMTKNLEFVFSKALDKLPLNCFVKSK